MVQRAASAASHLQGPETLIAQLDHLLSLVRSSYSRAGPDRFMQFAPLTACERLAVDGIEVRLGRIVIVL